MEQNYDDITIFSRYELVKIKTETSQEKFKDNGEPLKIYSFTFKSDEKLKILSYEENNSRLEELLKSLISKLSKQKELMNKRNNALIDEISIKVSRKRTAIRAGISAILGTLTFLGLNIFFKTYNIPYDDVAGLFNSLITLGVSGGTYYACGIIQPTPSKKDTKRLDKIAKNFENCNNLWLEVDNILRSSFKNVHYNKTSSLISKQKIKYYDDEYNFNYKR